jgi:acetyl esterase/lipase
MDEMGDVIAFQPREGVEVRHLRAFIVVAEELNFSRAAGRLYVTQPALSRQIRTLERAVGCELLRRSTHRVELTLAGAALLDRSRAVLAALDEAVTAAQSVGGELNARIMSLWAPMMAVSTPSASIEAMREVFESFLAQMPMPELAVRPVNAGGVPSLILGEEPFILYLHGGNYTMGSAYGYRPLAGTLVEAAERGALVPDFRLAPEHPFPAALEDALAAYQWLLERGGGAERIVLAGDSSGAALALAVLFSLKSRGQHMPAGAVLLCPLLDMTGAMLEPTTIPHPMDEIQRATEAYLAGHPIEDPLASPLRGDFAGLPPLLVQSATGDRARPEAEALAQRAAEHGVPVRLEIFAAEPHVFHVFASFLPEARDALAQAGEFMRDALAVDPASANHVGSMKGPR